MSLPWIRTSPLSGSSRPTRCLMSTLLPVPEGPRIVVIASSLKLRSRPVRISNGPNALWTSRTSIECVDEPTFVLRLTSLLTSTDMAGPFLLCGSFVGHSSVADRRIGRTAPEQLGSERTDHVNQDHVQNH